MRGFTLVELIVAAVIVSFVALALGATFISGMRLMNRAKKINFSQGEILLTLEMATKELSQCLKIPLLDFEGTDEELSFGYLKDFCLVKVEYQFKDKAFLRREADLKDIIAERESPETEPAPYRQKLWLACDDLRFSYFYFNAQKMRYEWIDEWKEKGKFPLAVKLELKIGDENFTKTIFIL